MAEHFAAQRDHYPEVLAPVGDFERLTYAVNYGADAVYLGGTAFGMRASSANFDFDTMKKAVEYAHARDVKVYLTCNTLPLNSEVEQLSDYLKSARDAGVDAVIVADIGVLMEAKRVIPEVDIHISTQTGIVNYLTANELYKMGAKRVVLARELPLEVYVLFGQMPAVQLYDWQGCQPRRVCTALPLGIPSGGRKTPGAVFPHL